MQIDFVLNVDAWGGPLRVDQSIRRLRPTLSAFRIRLDKSLKSFWDLKVGFATADGEGGPFSFGHL